MISLNARSIVNKVNELEHMLLQYDPHICVLTETWLHDMIRDDEIIPPGYKMQRRDRASRGGGVAIILKNSIDVFEIDQLEDHESLCLKVSIWGNTFVLCAVYRAPDSDDLFLSRLYDYLLKFRGKNIIITGDFNLPSVNWNDLNYGLSSSNDFILDMMFSLNLEQIVNDCTRGSAILDLLFVSESFSNGTVHVERGISDHKLICFAGNHW